VQLRRWNAPAGGRALSWRLLRIGTSRRHAIVDVGANATHASDGSLLKFPRMQCRLSSATSDEFLVWAIIEDSGRLERAGLRRISRRLWLVPTKDICLSLIAQAVSAMSSDIAFYGATERLC